MEVSSLSRVCRFVGVAGQKTNKLPIELHVSFFLNVVNLASPEAVSQLGAVESAVQRLHTNQTRGSFVSYRINVLQLKSFQDHLLLVQ